MRTHAVLAAVVGSTLLSATGFAQSTDEQLLKGIEQQLARAWTRHDRAFIESVYAPEWSVTQADGSVLTRSTVLGTFFDSVVFDTNVIDDVTVALFGTTAIVRGRTVASATLNGAPVSARIRFTDVFIKRKGRWQVVASHASPLAVSGTQPAAAAFHLLFDEALTKRQSAAIDAAVAPTHQGAWRDIPPTGRRVTVTEMFFSRTVEGKLAECWWLALRAQDPDEIVRA